MTGHCDPDQARLVVHDARSWGSRHPPPSGNPTAKLKNYRFWA